MSLRQSCVSDFSSLRAIIIMPFPDSECRHKAFDNQFPSIIGSYSSPLRSVSANSKALASAQCTQCTQCTQPRRWLAEDTQGLRVFSSIDHIIGYSIQGSRIHQHMYILQPGVMVREFGAHWFVLFWFRLIWSWLHIFVFYQKWLHLHMYKLYTHQISTTQETCAIPKKSPSNGAMSQCPLHRKSSPRPMAGNLYTRDR